MKHGTTSSPEGEQLMQRLEEMFGEHQQRIVAHLSPVELRDLLDYIEAHDRLAHTHLLDSTVDYIRKRLSL